MAIRLYRNDSFQRTFTATVSEVTEHQGRPALALDQTAFYPTAGGQPHDTGILNDLPVVDVVERKDGEILHVLAQPAPALAAGSSVNGEIMWVRRFDHMQQHSGQHVLSQAFVVTANLDTVAVHISADDCTLDLPTPKLSAEQTAAAETEANRIIYANLPFVIYEVSDADLPRIPLRRPPKVSGQIRIVEVKEFDWSACGGTHVNHTGQIGLLKITAVEKRGNETRVTFRCGGRAMRHYNLVNGVASRIANEFKVAVTDLESTIAKLRDDTRAQYKQFTETQEKLLAYEAEAWVRNAPICQTDMGEVKLVSRLIDRDPAQLRNMAKAIVAHSGTVAALACVTDKTSLCFARAADVKADARVLLKNALAALDPNARGGGSADFAQGGCAGNDAGRVQIVLENIRFSA